MGAGRYRELPQVTAFPPIWTGGPLIRVEAVGRSSVRKAVNLSSAAGMIQRRGLRLVRPGSLHPSAGVAVEGRRHSVIGADGVSIGLLTAGTGPVLLLVHGGMGRLEGWEPMWGGLAGRWRVTAMDRRGRGTSGDAEPYALSKEYDDIAAVAACLAEEADGPVDVFAHSYGATCTLGAAAQGAPFRRMALYEPPGPQANPREWVERATALVA